MGEFAQKVSRQNSTGSALPCFAEIEAASCCTQNADSFLWAFPSSGFISQLPTTLGYTKEIEVACIGKIGTVLFTYLLFLIRICPGFNIWIRFQDRIQIPLKMVFFFKSFQYFLKTKKSFLIKLLA